MTKARETPPPERCSRPVDLDLDGRAEIERDSSNRSLPTMSDDPDVGLSQKGTDEDAIVRRETDI